jgi:hypothetical protein
MIPFKKALSSKVKLINGNKQLKLNLLFSVSNTKMSREPGFEHTRSARHIRQHGQILPLNSCRTENCKKYIPVKWGDFFPAQMATGFLLPRNPVVIAHFSGC